MIRLIGRRLIIPRGDTGSFTIPVLSKSESDSIGVFTIFNPVTKTRVFQKQVEVQGDVFNIEFNHGETVNLLAGDYLWDIKFYINPIIEDNKVIDGTEVDSYYAAFQIPKCEIRETGDDFMVIEGQPAKIEDLNIILAATAAANAAKIAATEKAEEAAARLAEMVAAIPTKVSELENDSGYLQEETDPTVPDWAKAQTKPSYTPQEVGALPADTFIPSKVSDLTDDSGHYIKPVNGIPASDLEETYLTQHQDISMKANSADLAAVATSGDYSDLDNTPYIPTKTSDLVNDSSYPMDANYVHTDNNYTTAEKEKLAGIAAGAEVNVNADWNAASGDALILNKPTKVSDFTNDAGYLTEHQDISGKANTADLAAVATSGSYNDLEDKPFIPSKVSDLTDDSGHYTKPAGGIPASDLAETYLTAHQDISGKADKSEVPTLVSELTNDVGYITGYTETDPTVPAWAKAAQKPSYTAAEVGAPTVQEMNTAIGNAIGNINSFDMAVVQELPTQDISTHTIYLVPKTGETNDVYDEYVYINNAWEMVGNTQVDLSNYVQKTDYATESTAGLVKINATYGLSMYNGIARLYPAGSDIIKGGTNYLKAITPWKQHEAAFYGLATAAGDTTQSQSDNAVGAYTTEAKAAIRSMIGAAASADLTIQDVQMNGTSILNNGVANIPKATPDNYGVIKTNIYGSLGISPVQDDQGNYTGEIGIYGASNGQIKTGTEAYRPITPSKQERSVFYGLAKAAGDTTQASSSNAVGTYTDEAKTAIQQMLDVPSTDEVPIERGTGISSAKTKSILLANVIRENTASGDGSFAQGLVAVASGKFSTANGSQVTASGDVSHAEGNMTIASGINSHAEGQTSQALGSISHAEGSDTVAKGVSSHAEGADTIASGKYSHVAGQFNVEDSYSSLPEWISGENYAVGDKVKVTSVNNNETTINGYICRVANSDTSITISKWLPDPVMNYAEIIGNGTANNARSNARALDWDGNERLNGDLYVHCNNDSTGGSKVLCEVDFATDLDIQNIINGGAGA